ncbi:MAG TPA: methyltransferase domain-containing protein [Candidatus Nanoarchaeia archaeon]|nr:methyltransferase domain-containing protein [Candidatus Nanoarchaeia archaeon]
MVNEQRYSEFIQHWKKVQFPARPSPEELIVFDSLMQGHRDESLLILGSTPELRDIGFKNMLHVTCLDINPDMLEGMKQLMQHQNADEQLVKGNWLEMPFPNAVFDLIFAEQSIHIVPVHDFEKFLQQVKRVLAPEGIFVLKALVVGDEDVETILNKARAQHHDIFYLHDQLFNHIANYTDGKASYAAFQQYLSQFLTQGKITKEEYDTFMTIYAPLCKADLQIFGMPQEAFETLLRKYFMIAETRYGKDFDKHARHPLYVLRK